MQSKARFLLDKPYDEDSQFFPGIKGARGLAMQAFLSHIHQPIADFLLNWLNWQATHCPEEGDASMGTDSLVSSHSVVKILLVWREIETWNADEWTSARRPFIDQRIEANLTLVSLWKLVRTFYRRAELLRIVEPVIELYYSSSAAVTDEAVSGMRFTVNAAIKDLLKAETEMRVLYAEPPQAPVVRAAFDNADIRRDLMLFLIYSQNPELGNFARLPYNRMTGLTTPGNPTLLKEARTVTLLREDDIYQLHRECVARADNLALSNLTNLVPLAFPKDGDRNAHTEALLTCFAMSFSPDKDNLAEFEGQFALLRDYYAGELAAAANPTQKSDL
jgi:hypothetical protein